MYRICTASNNILASINGICTAALLLLSFIDGGRFIQKSFIDRGALVVGEPLLLLLMGAALMAAALLTAALLSLAALLAAALLMVKKLY